MSYKHGDFADEYEANSHLMAWTLKPIPVNKMAILKVVLVET